MPKARLIVVLAGIASITVAVLVVAFALRDGDGVVQRFVFERFVFEGHSMTPTLEDGEPIAVLDYAGRALSRGDIIAFALPLSPERLFFKRVIGLPGDTVEIDDRTGDVLINGVILDEPYVSSATGCSSQCSWSIPAVSAEVSIRYSQHYPRTSFANQDEEIDACAHTGCFFVLGDNRQNSSDSRQGWLVPAENIIGFVEVE